MTKTELLGVVGLLVTIIAGSLAIYDHFSEDDNTQIVAPAPMPPNETKIVVLARTTFNDSGQTYLVDFDGNVLKMNNSMVVALDTTGRE